MNTAAPVQTKPDMSIVPGSKQKKLFPQDNVAEWTERMEELKIAKGKIQEEINDCKNKLVKAMVEHGLVNYDVTLKDDSVRTLGINSKLVVKNKKK